MGELDVILNHAKPDIIFIGGTITTNSNENFWSGQLLRGNRYQPYLFFSHKNLIDFFSDKNYQLEFEHNENHLQDFEHTHLDKTQWVLKMLLFTKNIY